MVLMSAVMSFLCALSWQPAVFCPLLVKAKFRFVMRFKFVRDEPNLWEISSLTKFRFGHFLFGSACIESIVCRQIGCRSPWASCCFEVIWILKPLRAAESLFCIHFFSTSKEPATASGGAGAAPENKIWLEGCEFTDFKLGPILGTGSFGRVYLAYYTKTGQVFATKSLSKASIVGTKQVPHPRYYNACKCDSIALTLWQNLPLFLMLILDRYV